MSRVNFIMTATLLIAVGLLGYYQVDDYQWRQQQKLSEQIAGTYAYGMAAVARAAEEQEFLDLVDTLFGVDPTIAESEEAVRSLNAQSRGITRTECDTQP